MSALLSLFLDVTLSLPGLSFSKVRRYALTDALHTLPELTVEVLCDDPVLDLSRMIGERAVVHLDDPCFPRFDGIVRAVEQMSSDPAGVSCYSLTVSPALWLTTERSGHHIFRHRTVLEIAADVAARCGPAIAPPELRLSRATSDWPRHDYRVQYGEIDRDFLFRILAEEGLVSCWTPAADGSPGLVWTLTDDTSIGSAALEVPFRPPSGALAATGPHVYALTTSARLASSEARLRDHDYQHPALLLDSRSAAGARVPAEQPLVRYGYAVGDFAEEAAGQALATIRLQAARARSRVYRWETSFSAPAGTVVRLYDHPREEANGDFLVVAMHTEVDPGRRTHVAELVPAGYPWRPVVPPKPGIRGTQTAVVVGAPGSEIDVDEQGRVEVEFRWDTRDLHHTGASRRVRVAMPWMGAGRGFWTLPRVGDEVVIAYLDGDPDEPLVVGSVNNAVAPPAASLPKCQSQSWWKSKSTPGGEGFNAILMEDLIGAELLALYAERDSFWNTQRRAEIHVGENQVVQIGGSQSVNIGGGRSSGAGNVSVTAAGDYTLTAKALTVHSTADMAIQCDGSRLDTTSVSHTITAPTLALAGAGSATLAGGVVQVMADGEGASITLQVGGSSIEMTPDKITIRSPLVEINP